MSIGEGEKRGARSAVASKRGQERAPVVDDEETCSGKCVIINNERYGYGHATKRWFGMR